MIAKAGEQVELDAKKVARALADGLNGITPSYEIIERSDGPYLVFEVCNPVNRFYRALEEALKSLDPDNRFLERAALKKRNKTPVARLSLPETDLLRATISESLTVDRHSFEDDFFARYTSSVTNLERQIVTNGNFIVYGRRGAGKSSLLAFAMNSLLRADEPFAWLALQTYAGRGDAHVSIEVFREILDQLMLFADDRGPYATILADLGALERKKAAFAESRLQRLIPRIRTLLGVLAKGRRVTIFLDDIHVVSAAYQPTMLSNLYSVTRGNRCYIKASGIEQFTRPWNSNSRKGLEPTHDAQILKLDYNLTVPDKSLQHIESILDAHAHYCGIPNIRFLTGRGVLERLVWVAAAVPRDALAMFSLAISKASARDARLVSVTSVNAAASEMAEEKLKDIDKDASGDARQIGVLLEKIKEFCISRKRKNAFLIEIKNSDPVYRNIQRLIALRLVHVLHEGITPHKAGRRFLALMLDYGFYVGIRAATSVDLFQRRPRALTAKELRKLPILEIK